MTSQASSLEVEAFHECPICLASLVLPLTLSCGHTFCAPCIQSRRFAAIRQICPLCRKRIKEVSQYSVNVVLQEMLMSRYGSHKEYRERVKTGRVNLKRETSTWWMQLHRWGRGKWPWLIVAVLLYQLLKMKLKFLSLNFTKYKDKALKLANSIQVEDSLDFKFLLFSQFLRLLFSSIAMP